MLWSVDHKGGAKDITDIMRTFIGDKLDAQLAREKLVSSRRYLGGNDATAKALGESLRGLNPGLIVTTSHAPSWDPPTRKRVGRR